MDSDTQDIIRCYLDDQGIIQVSFIGKISGDIFYDAAKCIGKLADDQRKNGRRVLICEDIEEAKYEKANIFKIREKYKIFLSFNADKMVIIGGNSWAISVLRLLMTLDNKFRLFGDRVSAEAWLLKQ